MVPFEISLRKGLSLVHPHDQPEIPLGLLAVSESARSGIELPEVIFDGKCPFFPWLDESNSVPWYLPDGERGLTARDHAPSGYDWSPWQHGVLASGYLGFYNVFCVSCALVFISIDYVFLCSEFSEIHGYHDSS